MAVSVETKAKPGGRVPLGRAIRFTPATLEIAARVTDADIYRARRWWARYAPARFRRLLEAEAEPAAGPDPGGL